MILYITHEDKSKLKRCFLSLRKQIVISIDDVIVNLGYDPANLDPYSSFIVNEDIKKIITKSSSGKKSNNIIYCNHNFTNDSIRGLIHFVHDHTKIERVVFLTERNQYEDYYELFEEVMFFPTIKKVHILECEQFKNPIFRWVNDLDKLSEPSA
jgi:hypothetical protein